MVAIWTKHLDHRGVSARSSRKTLSFRALSVKVRLTCGPVFSTPVRFVGASGPVPTVISPVIDFTVMVGKPAP